MAPEQRLDALALVWRRPPQRRDQRQRALAFLEVRPDGLAQARLVGDEVERVVADLERDADIEPVAGEALDLPPLTPAEQGPDAAAGGHERRGLLGDDPEIVGLAGRAATLALELEDLGFRHGHGGARQGLEHAGVTVLDHEGEGLRVQVIAHEDRRIVAPARIRRGAAPAERSLVHDIVVDQGGGVQELDDAAHPDRARAPVPRQPRRHEEQDGAEALATRPRDELAHLVDQRHRRVDLAGDRVLDGLELGSDGESDPVLQQRLERRRGFHGGSARRRVNGRRRGLSP